MPWPNWYYKVRMCMHNKPWLWLWDEDLKRRWCKDMYFLYVFWWWALRTNVVRNHKCLEGHRDITSWSCHPSNWRLLLSQKLLLLFIYLFINNHYGALVQIYFLTHCFSISCAQWHLSISMHKSTSAQFVILATCRYL